MADFEYVEIKIERIGVNPHNIKMIVLKSISSTDNRSMPISINKITTPNSTAADSPIDTLRRFIVFWNRTT